MSSSPLTTSSSPSQTQIDTPGMDWSGEFSTQVATVEAVDDQTVHFMLQAPNSRFHSIFSVRWKGAWIMPEHIFSGVENVIEYDFANPVGLGPYVLHSYDPNGNWYIWEKREDWDRTSVADFGEPAPQYVIYRNNMPIDNRLIEMRNGDLDMIHDLSPEGMFSIVEEEDTVRGWFPGFPYAHPDPTLPMFIFNHQNEKFQDSRVRWALALMLDARGHVDGQLPRRGDTLGDLDPANRHASGRLPHSDAGGADQLRARYRRER